MYLVLRRALLEHTVCIRHVRGRAIVQTGRAAY